MTLMFQGAGKKRWKFRLAPFDIFRCKNNWGCHGNKANVRAFLKNLYLRVGVYSQGSSPEAIYLRELRGKNQRKTGGCTTTQI